MGEGREGGEDNTHSCVTGVKSNQVAGSGTNFNAFVKYIIINRQRTHIKWNSPLQLKFNAFKGIEMCATPRHLVHSILHRCITGLKLNESSVRALSLLMMIYFSHALMSTLHVRHTHDKFSRMFSAFRTASDEKLGETWGRG